MIRFVTTRILVLISALSMCASVSAVQWSVGPTHQYKKPSELARLVSDGDTVNIDAGIYESDVCIWSASQLLVRAIGGKAELRSRGNVAAGKAIWVIGGANCRVQNIAFYDARCVDANGAGIRLEASNLTVDSCLFEHNENGILCGAKHPSSLRIEHSEFNANGAGDGYSHNLYIGNIDTLVFQFNYTHHARIGHELKSRANVNIIRYNRISDELSGTASRSLDLPNGGTTILVGNLIEQGPLSENSNIIGFGLEGLTNPVAHQLLLAHNTLINNRSNGSFVQLKTGCELFSAENNVVVGPGTWCNTDAATAIVEHSNLRANDDSELDFSNSSNYDFSIGLRSKALHYGGQLSSTELHPQFEYLHPCSSKRRCVKDALDAGAFANCTTVSAVSRDDSSLSSSLQNHSVVKRILAEDIRNGEVHLHQMCKRVFVYSLLGDCILSLSDVESVPLRHLISGTYLIITDDSSLFVQVP